MAGAEAATLLCACQAWWLLDVRMLADQILSNPYRPLLPLLLPLGYPDLLGAAVEGTHYPFDYGARDTQSFRYLTDRHWYILAQ